jgi:hypothetical protein
MTVLFDGPVLTLTLDRSGTGFDTLTDRYTLSMINFDSFDFSGETRSLAELAGVAPVPLPATALLLGGALLGLGGLRRRG